jgi:DNA (cytosine-5)-methyltransferase 1
MLSILEEFAGIGAVHLAAKKVGGFEVKQAIEIDPDAQKVYGHNWPSVPIHDDIKTYTCTYQGFDVHWSSFPCTGTSVAGDKSGLSHQDSSLWFESVRLFREGKPKYVVIENPTGLLDRGMDGILWALSEGGYDAEWQSISARAFGSPQRRERLFIIAYVNDRLRQLPQCWSDTVRGEVQAVKSVSRYPSVVSGNDGAHVQFPVGLDSVPIGCDRKTPKRFESRKLFGRTIDVNCAAIALRRVLYLEQCSRGT